MFCQKIQDIYCLNGIFFTGNYIRYYPKNKLLQPAVNRRIVFGLNFDYLLVELRNGPLLKSLL